MEKQSTRLAELLEKVMQTEDGREFFFELLELMTFTMSFGSEAFMGYEIGRHFSDYLIVSVVRHLAQKPCVIMWRTACSWSC